MQVPKDYVPEDLDRTPSVKRTDSSLTPPKEDVKKTKMADKQEVEPIWVAKLASKEDIQSLASSLDNFKTKCFEPFKKEVLERVEKIEQDVNQFPQKLEKLESDFKDALDFNSNDLKDMDKKVCELQKDNKALHEQVGQLNAMILKQNKEKLILKNKIIDIEDRQRRDNLVLEGISDSSGETSQVCESKARKFMKDELKIQNAGKVVIGRVHRLGTYKQNHTRPTIVKFDLYKQRNAVWNGRKNLPQNSKMGVKENFSKETEKARAQLTPILKIARKKGYFAKLECNRLIISDSTRDVNVTVTIDSLDKLPDELQPEKIFTPTRNNITLFYSKHSPHSNFYYCEFSESGKDYTSVEQYLVHNNARASGDESLASRVMKVNDPAIIKSMGRDISNIEDDTRMNNMKKGMLLKYGQNPNLLEKLRATEGTTLAEANPYDKFWGIGLRITDDKAFDGSNSWLGQNITGKLAMEVRSELCRSDWDSDTEHMGEGD